MIPYQRAAFYTLGCKLNFAETSTLARALQEQGYARVSFDERADIYVINTCSVTENADKECKQVVKKALKQNPLALVVVTGCYAQLKPQEVANIAGVDLVLGANEKFDIALQVAQLQHKKAHAQVQVQAIKEARHFHASYSMGDRTRTFLKVQDGCDYFCAFCTIPLARGRSRSASIADTIQKAEIAIAEGSKEIVLTGVNLGDFGSGTDENFLQLIEDSFGNWVIEIQNNTHYQIGSCKDSKNLTLVRNGNSVNVTLARFKREFNFATIGEIKRHLSYLNKTGRTHMIIDDCNGIKSEMIFKPKTAKEVLKDIMNIKYCDFYMVSVDGKSGSTVRHTSYESAEKEAVRLCELLNAETFIVGVVASVKPKPITKMVPQTTISHEIINRTKKTMNND